MLRLAFNPPTTRPITFHVAVSSTRKLPYEPGGAKTNLTKFASEYDAVLRFVNRKSHRFALHGRIQNAKISMQKWSKEEEKELSSKLNLSVVTATFDRQGKTVEPIIAFEPNNRDGSLELTSYLDELAGRTFGGLRHRCKADRQDHHNHGVESLLPVGPSALSRRPQGVRR